MAVNELNGENSNMEPHNVIFNCSPSLGILDNWMPIISPLRERLPNSTFIFVAPKARTVRELDLSSWLHHEAAITFDKVVFKDDSDQWYSSDAFGKSVRLSKKLRPWFLIRVLRKMGLGIAASYMAFLQRSLNRMRFAKWSVDFCINEKESGIFLFDICAIDNPYAAYIEKHFWNMEKYSLFHGIAIRGLGEVDSLSTAPVSLGSQKKINALLFSHEECEFYEKKYALPASNLHVIGIPRHEVKWLAKLEAAPESTKFTEGKRFIFVIGRPSNARYLPRDRKIKALLDIREVAEKYGLDVVVKTHPKEHDDAAYRKAFKRMSRGLSFRFSNSHPLVLGKHCDFAVSFYSSVSSDMVRLGVPMIERLDLRGLTYADHDKSLRDSNDEPVKPYRYLGLALGASDREAFQAQVDRVMRCRDEVVAEQRAAYDRIYPTIPDVNEKIARDIASAVR